MYGKSQKEIRYWKCLFTLARLFEFVCVFVRCWFSLSVGPKISIHFILFASESFLVCFVILGSFLIRSLWPLWTFVCIYVFVFVFFGSSLHWCGSYFTIFSSFELSRASSMSFKPKPYSRKEKRHVEENEQRRKNETNREFDKFLRPLFSVRRSFFSLTGFLIWCVSPLEAASNIYFTYTVNAIEYKTKPAVVREKIHVRASVNVSFVGNKTYSAATKCRFFSPSFIFIPPSYIYIYTHNIWTDLHFKFRVEITTKSTIWSHWT